MKYKYSIIIPCYDAEDYDFNIRVRKGKKENILDMIYFYRNGRQDSLSWKALRK